MAIVLAILLFSLLIFVHELGHFITAKLFGVQVNEFAMFMGPAIFKKKKGETLYTIRCIPFGGYCAMEGEDGASENPRAFGQAKWWKRLIILLAGSFMNLVAGFLLLLIVQLPNENMATAQIESFAQYCTIDGEHGLQPGDTIVEIDGEAVYFNTNIDTILMLNPGDIHDIVVERNGEEVLLENFRLEWHTVEENGVEVQRMGITFVVEELNFGAKLRNAWFDAVDAVRSVRFSLQMLFSGDAGVSDMMGPVGLVDFMNQTAQSSSDTWIAVLRILYIGGIIAMNLAVMNLLPIPALDGGRAVGLLITTAVEKITHKKVNPKYEGWIHAIGMIPLLALMGYILFKDIFAIFTR